jgi:hypothetical protein
LKSQQPKGHVCELQPPPSGPSKTHCWAEQTSPNWKQFWQKLPKLPHWSDAKPGWQKPLVSQQPNGHVCELHCVGGVHCWFRHLFPDCSQLKHEFPKDPHWSSKTPDRQTPDGSQQPLLQFHGPQVGRHCWFWQISPNCWQFWQNPPPKPHANGCTPCWQTPLLSQQPN